MDQELLKRMRKAAPKIHCLTNPVSMQDVANLLLTAGGSAIMGQDPEEAAEITAFCQATLLNTGVPDREKLKACRAAGKKANELSHPVVLDPVGAGASRFRREQLAELLKEVRPSAIRCNQEEACALLDFRSRGFGGVESSVSVEPKEQKALAKQLALEYGCAVLISGTRDAVSDGAQTELLEGGDPRTARITGSGCMLSALCALFAGAGIPGFEALLLASELWKESAREAGKRTDEARGGMGSFHGYLFDALDMLCREEGGRI